MTPTATGFAAEGLLRQLQPDIWSLVGCLLTIFVALWIIHSFVSRVQKADGVSVDDAKKTHGWINWGATIASLLVIIGFVGHAISVIAVNRMPRSEFRSQDVFKQMDSLIKRNPQ